MPRSKALDTTLLAVKLRTHLSAREPVSAKELLNYLGISQASFSRIVKGIEDEIIRIGKGPSLRYTLKREIFRVGPESKVYEVTQDAKAKTLGTLQFATPKAFVFQKKDSSECLYFSDLPYFLEDMRPSGFLGRVIPQRHPEMNWPSDIQDWSGDDVIQYISNFGWSGVGNLLLGSKSLARFLETPDNPATLTPSQRKKHFLKLANETLATGPAGSSAGGEQPKFLVDFKSGKSAIVKFSPSLKTDHDTGQRFADLLICEHLALRTLAKEGIDAAKTEVFRFEDRSFLEVERFDRNTKRGRRGLISLRALSIENGLSLSDAWHLSWDKLKIDRKLTSTIRKIYYFGQMIHNTDMHYGNLSFYFEDLKVTGIAPVYDMLPMAYAPQRGEITDKEFNPPLPTPETFEDWGLACTWAQRFWNEVKKEKAISPSFRAIAERNIKKLDQAAKNASALNLR